VILHIRVVPRASRNLIKREKDRLKVYLTKPAQDNLANIQLIDLLVEYLKVKKYQIQIIRGRNLRDKLIKIDV